MSNREFNATRTMLANGMATAGAELLEYMNVGAALAAIPNTDPPKYVVAGTLQMIAQMLPGFAPTVRAHAAVSEQIPTAPEVRKAALEEAARLIEKKVEAYYQEHGSYDRTTGVTEYPGDGAEWICEMGELAEEIRALKDQSTADKASEVRAAEDAPLNGIPATMMHDEGAIARCFYCGRYSLDRATLGPDSRQPVCECGKQHGWSGSFKKPDANARWSGAAPSTADSANTGALGEKGADRG